MGWQENLTERNVEELTEKLKDMQKENSELDFGFYEMEPKEILEKGRIENEMLQLILDKVEALDRKIDRILVGII